MTNLQSSATTKDVSSLSPNQQKALQALLTTTSIGAAAEQCGLHIGTVKRYLADETFAAVYRNQRALVLQETVAALQHLGTKAVEVIEGTLDDSDDPNAQLRAARHALDYIVKLVELERRIRDQDDLERRVEELEAQASRSSNGHRRY